MSILLTKCGACGMDVSVKAPACPQCGHPNVQPPSFQSSGAVDLKSFMGPLLGRLNFARIGTIVFVLAGLYVFSTVTSKNPGEAVPREPGGYQNSSGTAGMSPATRAVPQQASPQQASPQQRTASKFGPKPQQSQRNGPYREVVAYLRQAAKDPQSLQIERCGEPHFEERAGWLVGCEFRTNNARGQMTGYENWFVIQDQRVVKLLGKDEYKPRGLAAAQSSRSQPAARGGSRPMAAARYRGGGDDCSAVCRRMDQCGFWSYDGCVDYCHKNPGGNEKNHSQSQMSCQQLAASTGFNNEGNGTGNWQCRAVGSYVYPNGDGSLDYGSPQHIDVIEYGRTRDIASNKALDGCIGLMRLSVNNMINGRLETDSCKVIRCLR